MHWHEGALTEVSILARRGGICRVRYGDRCVALTTEKGERYRLNAKLEQW